MDRLKETERYKVFKKGDDLEEYLRKELIWIEKLYAEIAKRVNRLLKITVDNDGDVGIGTTKPVQKLVVAAPYGLPASSGISQNGIFRVRRSDSGHNVLDLGVSGISPFVIWLQATRDNDLSIEYPLLLNPNGGNVGIGTASPTNDAKLDVAGTEGAFMPPRLTTTQRDALTPSNGMFIYNATTNQFEGYENGGWVDL